jgi:hypothetical protein
MWGMDRLRGIAMEKMRGLIVYEPEEWMKVLDMADMQGLSDARALAIERLSRLSRTDSVAKIQLEILRGTVAEGGTPELGRATTILL